MPDHYAVLGLTSRATGTEISRAYRILMRQHHPDTRAPTEVAGAVGFEARASEAVIPFERRLIRIMDAYHVLGDPARRAAYDQGLVDTAACCPSPSRSAVPVVVHVRSPHHGPSPPIQASPVRWHGS